MKQAFLLIALHLTNTTLAQRTIDNEVTQNHVRVDGTNLYIIPPQGFFWSSHVRQFTNEDSKASILINEIETSIEVVHQQMSKKELLGQGTTWISEEVLSFSGLRGYLIKASRQNFSGKVLVYTLAFGDSKITRVVQCIFPAEDSVSPSDIERTLLTTVFKPVVTLNNEQFSLTYDAYGFSFWKNVSGINYYRAAQKRGRELIIMTDFFFVKNNTEPELIFLNRMQRLPYSSVKLDDNGIADIELDGVSGLQGTIAGENEEGQRVYVYQVILKQRQNYFLMQGVCFNLDEIKTIKEVFASFKKKF